MQHFLPIRLAKHVNLLLISFSKKIKLLLLTCGLLVAFSMQASAQEPEIIKGWDNLEEADFFFDVYFRIVKCSGDSDPEIQLIAFNEGGKVSAVGFDLVIKDEAGNSASHKVEKFDIEFGQTFMTSCENDDHSNLKFPVPEGIDPYTISIDITYNK